MVLPRGRSCLLLFLLSLGLGCSSRQEGNRDPDRDGIRALGYVGSSRSAPDRLGKHGVQLHDPTRAQPGVNLWPSQDGFTAELLDMDGKPLHRWDAGDPFPSLRRRLHNVERWWEYVVLTGDGQLICEADHNGLARLGWNSEPLWTLPLLVHHELELADDGDIYTFVSVPKFVTADDGGRVLLLDNPIAIVSPDGKLKRTISYLPALMREPKLREAILDIVGRSDGLVRPGDLDPLLDRLGPTGRGPGRRLDPEAYAWLRRPGVLDGVRRLLRTGEFDGAHETFFALRMLGIADPLHANTLRILERHPAGLWNDGDLLISLRSLDLVFVVDPRAERVVWRWGPGELTLQHAPVMLSNGNLLIFDNGTSWSRVVELDPAARRIEWSYEADPRESFFSSQMGAAEPLANGNVLVTSSMQGRVFEITREGETVWEWLTPTEGDRHEVVYRMLRYGNEFVAPFLNSPAPPR